ncbi:MAG: protein-glutamate O-methyltransferase CheR [Deltaproteobacteria bacterium]|nr:protein-glutamate O-methyltransferase CheR [Deltaproteobacteria bacterium]
MNTPPAILRFLAASLGMEEDAAGKEAVGRALAAAMRQEGLSDAASYEKLFSSSPDVRQRFIDAMVVGETWFFRDRGPFTYLARHSRELRNLCPGAPLRILSAPCATGEEPYSIAMTLLAAGVPPQAFSIDAVDVSLMALNRAREACYGSSAFRGNLGEDVAPFFETTRRGRRITDRIVRQVAFLHDNLVSPGSLAARGPYAVIFCRNLLIYLTAEARRRVYDLLDGLLIPGGLLFTGHTETIFWSQQGYLPIQWDRAFALSKPLESPAPKAAKKPAALKLPPAAAKSPPPGVHAAGPISAAAQYTSVVQTPAAQTPAAGAVQRRARPDQITTAVGTSDSSRKLQEARGLADRGDTAGALRLCEEDVRTFGPTAGTYCLMGVIRMADRDFNTAEDCFVKALYLDPGHYESLVHLSLICGRKGNEKKAALYRERAERQAGILRKAAQEAGKLSETRSDEDAELKTT